MAPAKTRKLRVWVPLPPSNREPRWCGKVSSGRFHANINRNSRVNLPLVTNLPTLKSTHPMERWRFSTPLQQRSLKSIGAWITLRLPMQPRGLRHSRFSKLQMCTFGACQELHGDRRIRFSQFRTRTRQQFMKAIDWVDKHLTYDSANASLTADPAHGLIHRRGHCSDYHGLCGTFAREIGYPSRVLYGLQMFDKGSPSHCKLEVLHPTVWLGLV